MAVTVRNFAQLECEIVTDFRQLEAIASDWHRLWKSSPRAEIFQHFGWARSSWRAFSGEMSLFTPVVYRGSELIGIVPLVVSKGTLQFLATDFSDYNDILCEDEMARDVIESAVHALLRGKQHWATSVLDNVPADSHLARHLPELRPSILRHFRTVFKCPCPTIALDENGEIASQLAKKESLRRHEKQLRKRGQLSFRHIEDPQEVEHHLGLLFHQHIGRRAILGDQSHFLEPSVCTMFKALAEELSLRTLLRFSVLSLDEQPVACHLGFETGNRFVFYQTAFDIDYWKSSPGEVLFRHLLLYAGSRKLSEFDLTRGGELYKDRFASDIRANLTILFNHDLGARRRIQMAVRQANGSARQVLEKLRKYPHVYRFARTAALRCIETYRRERRLRKLQGSNYAPTLIRRAYRSFIFDRAGKVTFAIGKQQVKKQSAVNDSGACVARASLNELAVMAAVHPEFGIPLGEFHQRLISGQQLYCVWQGPELLQVWSVDAHGESHCDPSLSRQALALEQCWTANRASTIQVLNPLLRQISDKEMDVLVRCDERAHIVQEMRDAGLRPLQRTLQFRLLHWFRPVLVFRMKQSPKDCLIPSEKQNANAGR